MLDLGPYGMSIGQRVEHGDLQLHGGIPSKQSMLEVTVTNRCNSNGPTVNVDWLLFEAPPHVIIWIRQDVPGPELT